MPKIRPVAALVADTATTLTVAERRVARCIVDDPSSVAFGTVAAVATRSGTSGPTVLRCAAKLGFDGFVALQASVQSEMADQLRPAKDRIRETKRGNVLARVAAIDAHNVRATMEAVDPNTFECAVELLSDCHRRVCVIASQLSGLAGRHLADQLGLLRDGVTCIDHPGPSLSRSIVDIASGDVVIAVDLRRYERWVVEAVGQAAGLGAAIVALTDSHLSPLAAEATHTFVLVADGAGPFDSPTGGIALANALAATVAARLRRSAARRLDAIDAAWANTSTLVES